MKLHTAPSFALASMAVALLAACSPSEKAAAPAAADTAASTAASAPALEAKKIAITAIVEHPALDAARQGVLDELKEQGYEEGKNLTVDFQSAQGSTANAAQIAKKFVGDNPDLIVAISTPSAQSALASTKTIPIVFAAVTDPVAAKLVPSWEQAGANISGVSDLLPLTPQIDLMKKIVPNVKNIGYVYSPGEVNSTVVLDELKEKLTADGINVVAAPAQRSSDVLTAARSLNGKVDVVYTSLDNNVVSQYESMYKAAVEMKRPLVAADTGSVERGAVAALGVNYYDMGRKAGQMAAGVLKDGKSIADLPPARMDTLDLFLSKKNAAAVGVTLPEELLKEAKEVQE
ncbi:ABC transporter substrate-binding protein [Neisseria leonii]|uniref:ABC transporter substrate-binding protein n=1 Tax=Neisseria leonii TaxID=2995413 RepID=UPI00237ABA7F|nr:ABC transporter substrate-binding protein [Neisseria sp. 3986]MDD9326223.1 ABC transporter substrate-binding protein [Neisseria sp. 3986]